MKSILRLFLVPLVALTFAGVSFAQATPATPAKPVSPEKKTETKTEAKKGVRVTGDLVSADAKAGKLTLKVKDKDMNFVAESREVKSALEKVKVGDKLTVRYTEKDGKMIADGLRSAAKTK